MNQARLVALALLLAVVPGGTACVCPPWVCGWPDGDEEPLRDDDDDDDLPLDDDDAVDDDDDVLDALTFVISFEATPAAGDDDDSAGDDDDSAGDDDDSAEPPDVTDIEGTLVTRYWTDHGAGALLCEQHVSFDGEARFAGAPDCAGCDGFLQLRASSVVDVSNPLLDDDHCDPSLAAERGLDYGRLLLRPVGVGGLGDFLSIALVDAETGIADGLAFAPGDDLTYAAQAEALEASGAVLTHGGYLRGDDGGMVVGAGIDQAAGTPSEGDEWFAFWRIFRDPSANSFDGDGLRGVYGATSVWIVFPR